LAAFWIAEHGQRFYNFTMIFLEIHAVHIYYWFVSNNPLTQRTGYLAQLSQLAEDPIEILYCFFASPVQRTA